MIDKKELKYIAYCIIFAAIYFFLVLPKLMELLDGGNVLLKFIIFNIGIIALLNIYLKSRSLNTKIDFIKSIEYTLVVLAISVYLPPYHIQFMSGELVDQGILAVSSSDYFFGWVGTNYLHLQGILVSIWTFLVVPAVLLFIASRISKSNFVKNV